MHSDVIIIGGGVIGTACAYYLSGRGAKVQVMERNHLGAGASGTTAAIISISGGSGTPEPLRPLNAESYHLLLDAEQDFDQPIEIMRGGTIYAALNEQQALDLRPVYDEIRQMGISCKLFNGMDARRFEPLLGAEVTATLFNPASYHINPFRLVAGYMGAALRRGARVDYGMEVQKIKINSGRIDRIVTDKGDYHADWVVVAGGAFTPQILSSLGLQIPIVPARGQVILTEACEQMTESVIMLLSHLYAKQTASGNFYIGSHTEFVGFDNRITLEKITTFTQTITRALPILGRLRVLRFFTGLRPVCEDNLPIISPVPCCPRLIVASGHGRTGVRFSASTGKVVSELVMDGKAEQPIEAFALDRFTKIV